MLSRSAIDDGLMRWPASALLASILLIVITIQGAAENQGQWGRVRLNYTGSVDTRDQCPRLRIGIINGVNFHFEVLSGLIHLLQPYERHIDVFLSPYARTANFDGAWELVKWSRCTFRRTDAHEHPGEADQPGTAEAGAPLLAAHANGAQAMRMHVRNCNLVVCKQSTCTIRPA